MRFSTIHKLSTYLMALSALAALLLSPEIGLPAAGLSLAAVALSWFAEPGRFPLERFSAAWNIATVLFLFYLVTDVIRGGAVLMAGAHFLLFVLCNKLFNRRGSRDYLQACVLSFLLLVVATTLNTSPSYAVAFTAFVVFATWALILLHLRSEMEDNYLLKHSEGAQSEKVEVERILSSRRVVGGRFLLGTSTVSLGVILLSALVFLLFPRVGFSLFRGQRHGGVLIAGFQDRVELGHHGLVRDNPAVVMRVDLGGAAPAGPLRWRGSAFDTYQNGVWSHAEDLVGRTQMVVPEDGLYVVNYAPGLPTSASPKLLRQILLRQDIYLEPLDSNVLFAADRPVAVEAGRGGLEARLKSLRPRRGPLGEIRTGAVRGAGHHYVAYSQIRSPSPELLRQARPLRDPQLQRFLQLPEQLPTRIAALARQITEAKDTLYQKVMAIQDHLRANYRYTLNLTHIPGAEPVDEFLFVTRRGHCEYFASAMTLLLRTQGIHARNVNGFAGGVWNSYGNYWAVRQGDAHSWVEVLFPNLGWVTFDPTPPSTTAAPAGGVLTRLRELLDAVRMRWYRHVVEYDVRQQVSMLRKARHWLRARRPGRSGSLPLAWLAAAALAAVVLVVLLRRRRSRQQGGDRSPRLSHSELALVSRHYRRALQLLARAGFSKPPGLTPGEFTEELQRRGCPVVQQLERLTTYYYDVRYGGDPLAARAAEMTALLKELGRGLQASASRES